MKTIFPLIVTKPWLLLPIFAIATVTTQADVKEEYRDTFPLASDGRVSLKNVNGSIEVVGWDRNEVSVYAVKKGKNQDVVDRIEIEIDADENSFSLDTKLPKIRSWFFGGGQKGSVSYEIKVPFTANLHNVASVNGAVRVEHINGRVNAYTVNGAVRTFELKGDVELSAVNGSVKAVFSDVPLSGSIKMDVVNGSVSLEVPRDTNAYFRASTVNGGIRSDFDLPIKKRFPIGANLDGQKGVGGPDIKLNSVNGGISIKES